MAQKTPDEAAAVNILNEGKPLEVSPAISPEKMAEPRALPPTGHRHHIGPVAWGRADVMNDVGSVVSREYSFHWGRLHITWEQPRGQAPVNIRPPGTTAHHMGATGGQIGT